MPFFIWLGVVSRAAQRRVREAEVMVSQCESFKSFHSVSLLLPLYTIEWELVELARWGFATSNVHAWWCTCVLEVVEDMYGFGHAH